VNAVGSSISNFVEQGICVEKTEPLQQMKIPVPPEVAARVPVETAGVVESSSCPPRAWRPASDQPNRPTTAGYRVADAERPSRRMILVSWIISACTTNASCVCMIW